jgi:hypothetical protein
MNKVLVDQKQMALAAQAVPFFNEDAVFLSTLLLPTWA